MSSTRDSLSALREENNILSSMKHQLKDSQEMVNDLQKLIAINREAISLFADSNPSAKDKIVQNLRSENALIFQTLIRTLETQRKLEHTVDSFRLRAENADEMVRMLKLDMTQRVSSMMINLSKAENESISQGKKSSKKHVSGGQNSYLLADIESSSQLREHLTQKKEIETLQSMLLASREAIRRLKQEKKELLKTNFNLSSEIMKMKALLSTSTGYRQFMLQSKKSVPELKESFGEEIEKIINFHSKYMADDNIEASEKSDYSLPPLETDVNKSDEDDMLEGNILPEKKPPHIAMPSLKLDLTKAKEIQHEVAKKLIEKQNVGSNKEQSTQQKDDKFIQLELENSRLSKMLQSEIGTLKLIKKENFKLKSLNTQLLVINQVLVDSNKKLMDSRQSLTAELDVYRHVSNRVLRSLYFEALNTDTLDRQSSLFEFFKNVSKEALNKGSPDFLDHSAERKVKTKKKVYKEGAKELASSLSSEVNNLKLVKDVARGKKIQPSDRVAILEDKKAWSFCEEHEKMESNFETKRDSIQNTYVLEGL